MVRKLVSSRGASSTSCPHCCEEAGGLGCIDHDDREDHVADFGRLEFEGGDDPEVAAGAANGPEQFRVVLVVHAPEGAIGK